MFGVHTFGEQALGQQTVTDIADVTPTVTPAAGIYPGFQRLPAQIALINH